MEDRHFMGRINYSHRALAPQTEDHMGSFFQRAIGMMQWP